MNLLFRVLRAAHAKGTHHKLALDAVSELRIGAREPWQRLFLANAGLMMQGSKAPDDEFKDFKNHVLHPRDDYWGGAPAKVEAWYAHLVTALSEHKWSEAAWCAGVMSHYYTDPIHPFHTAQSEAENAIHRAVEWSISRDYDRLRAEALARLPAAAIPNASGPGWVSRLVCAGADLSNAAYEKLIAHYDINAGVVDPPAGLDPVARRLVGDLLCYASAGTAHLIDRAIAESGATPPEISLGLDTVLATLKIPMKLLAKKLADAEDRRIVEAMYDELRATGRVEESLPEDDRAVRAAYAREVLAQREAQRAAAREDAIVKPRSLKAQKPMTSVRPAASAEHAERMREKVVPAPITGESLGALPPMLAGAASAVVTAGRPASAGTSNRRALAPGDPLEAAPSIGPRMAERLAVAGLVTVGDLLTSECQSLLETLGDPRISASTVTAWQDQARLAIAIPGLRSAHAQLLTGAGYRDTAAIAAARPDKLSADVLAFATTADGQRILREGAPPDIGVIHSWITAAHATLEAA